MTSDRRHDGAVRRVDRRLGLEGRRTFPTLLRSTAGPGRRRVLTGSALVSAVVVAILVAAGITIDIDRTDAGVAASSSGLGVLLTIAVSVLSGIAAAALVAYAVARVFLILDVRSLPTLAWQHDGILVRSTGSEAARDPEPFAPDLAGPLAAAADAAEVRMVWGVVIGWAQCVLGAAVFVIVVIGMLAGGGVPWILAVVTFIVGGLGQDMAARSLRTLGRAAEARRLVAGLPFETLIDEGQRTGPGAPVLRPASTDRIVLPTSTGPTGSARSGSSGRTARRMPPRAPGRGSSLELPGE